MSEIRRCFPKLLPHSARNSATKSRKLNHVFEFPQIPNSHYGICQQIFDWRCLRAVICPVIYALHLSKRLFEREW